ncbi:MAG: thermonuclease family protein [Chloroflexus sp.]|nr:thermonuclease family protein [Chloroflexus sp.]
MRRRRRATTGISGLLIGTVLACCAIGIIGVAISNATSSSSQPTARPAPAIDSRQELPTAPATPLGASPTAAKPPATPTACLEGLTWEPATLLRVIDGDTIEVRINGSEERVRYIGVDTPERGHPWFDEATQANRRLVEEGQLWLARDVSERDRYGRLLRYVIAGNQFVNLTLVEQGLAQVVTYPPDVRCVETYLTAQQQARANGIGLWANSTTPRPPSAATTEQQCHPAYPDICIPPPPPDLDCSDIAQRRFRVDWAHGDPHGFDGDRDGVGCER